MANQTKRQGLIDERKSITTFGIATTFISEKIPSSQRLLCLKNAIIIIIIIIIVVVVVVVVIPTNNRAYLRADTDINIEINVVYLGVHNKDLDVASLAGMRSSFLLRNIQDPQTSSRLYA